MNFDKLQEGAARLTAEERRANAVKAGIASGIARKRRRLIRDTMSSMMTVYIPDGDIRATLSAAGFEPTIENAISFSALLKAASGDIEAAKFCRDSLGEKPIESFNVSASATPIQDMDLSQLTNEELAELAAHCESDAEDSAN